MRKKLFNHRNESTCLRTFFISYCMLACFFASPLLSLGQGTGIGIGTSSVHESAVLHIDSDTHTQGVLLPTMDATQRAAVLPDAQDGLSVYDETEHVFYQKNNGHGANGIWQALVSVPRGIIVMWSGSVASIPDGWVLCDGSFYNPENPRDTNFFPSATHSRPTPNLRGRFVVGLDPANSAYDQASRYSEGIASARYLTKIAHHTTPWLLS